MAGRLGGFVAGWLCGWVAGRLGGFVAGWPWYPPSRALICDLSASPLPTSINVNRSAPETAPILRWYAHQHALFLHTHALVVDRCRVGIALPRVSSWSHRLFVVGGVGPIQAFREIATAAIARPCPSPARAMRAAAKSIVVSHTPKDTGSESSCC